MTDVPGQDFPVFSPSQTENFLRCPRMWWLGKRWAAVEVWSPERAIGKAVDAGLLDWLHTQDEKSSLYTANESLRSDWPDDAPFEVTFDSAFQTVKRVLTICFKKLPDELTGKLVTTHPRLGSENCEPDIIWQSEHGWYEILDIKYTHSIQPQYVGDRLRQFEPSGQLRHYAWRVGEAYGRVHRVGIIFITGSPKADTKVAWFDIDPTLQEKWLEGRKTVWRQMDLVNRGLLEPWDSDGNCFKYGMAHACPFYTAHFRLNLNEDLFGNHYVLREPNPAK